jgi:hypothetical protein
MLIGTTPIGSLPGIGDSFIERTKSYTMDQWTIFTGSTPLEGGAIRYSMNRVSDLLIKKTLSKTYLSDTCLSIASKTKAYTMNIGLLQTLRGIEFGLSLVPAYELTVPSTSVLNALVWSWAETFDAVWRQMDTMATAMKLESAQSTDLDLAWGQIFDLPRIVGEDDTNYRDRLKTRTLILNSSGTKANCENIIDSIIEKDSTSVNSRYPATIDITFSTVSAMRIARSKLNLLNLLIPQMVASGINYNLYMPYIDYYCDTMINGPYTLPYHAYLAINQHNIDETYLMDFIGQLQNKEIYSTDSVILKKFYKYLSIGLLTNKLKEKSCIFDTVLFGIITKSLLLDSLITKKNIICPLIMKSYFRKYNLEKSFSIDQLSKITKRRSLSMTENTVFHKTETWTQDMLLRLFIKTFNMDILNKRSFPKRHGMVVTLVRA